MNVLHTAVGDMPTNAIRALQAELLPCLIFEGGLRDGNLFAIDDRTITAGRSMTNELPLEGETVSRRHCTLAGEGPALTVTDLSSTNGTYVNELPVREPQLLRIGDLLRIGEHKLRYMLRSRAEVRMAETLEADLDRAARYVTSLLPARIERGPVVVDWEFVPSMQLGGDVFSYFKQGRGMVVYLLGVSGTGVGAAMHATAIKSVLAPSSLPAVDMTDPTQVLEFLNARFQMESHQGMCLTIWYGYYDIPSRRLTYASGGHHPALMVSPDRKHIVPLGTRDPVLGALPSQDYAAETMDIPPSWSLYLFSDGAYNITDVQGRNWGLSDFEGLIRIKGPVEPGEPGRILRALRTAQSGGFEDDCSILTMTFV